MKKNSTISRILGSLKPYKGTMIIAIILSVIAQLFSVLVPAQISGMADTINEGLNGTIDMEKILHIMMIALIMIVVVLITNTLQSRFISRSIVLGCSDIRKQLNEKIDRIKLNYYDTHQAGDIVARATSDLTIMSETMADNLANMISQVILLVFCLGMMLYVNIPLCICVVISVVIGMFLNSFIMGKSQPLFSKRADGIGRMNAQIDECFNGHLIIKAFNSEDEMIEKFDALNESVASETSKAKFLTAILEPISSFFSNLGFVAVCIVGAYLMLQPEPKITIGVIVAFTMFSRLFSNSMTQLLEATAQLQPAMASANRVFELLDEEEMDPEEQTDIESAKGAVEFSHVRFGYDPNKIIIKDFSASVKPGYKIAIVGPTGAGKSTLVNLLMRFYELNGGKITIDGTDISQINRENLHEMLGMVLQETWTFEGTLRDNIVYSSKNVSEEKLNSVIDEVGLRSLVESLPQGLDTVISESTAISAGQKQLITIARVMIENAPIIILDEATSSIDTRTEILIQNAVDQLTSNRTSFVIAHRLSTIKNSNLIFVMKDGDVVDIGPHEELLAKGGLYADLYNSQFD